MGQISGRSNWLSQHDNGNERISTTCTESPVLSVSEGLRCFDGFSRFVEECLLKGPTISTVIERRERDRKSTSGQETQF